MMMCRYPSILNIKGFSPVDPDNENNESILTDYYEMTLSLLLRKRDAEEIITRKRMTTLYFLVLQLD